MNIREKMRQVSEKVDFFPNLEASKKEANRLKVEISKIIYNKRKAMGITQADLAKKLGVKQPMVCQYENGEHNMTIETMASILSELSLRLSFYVEDESSHKGIDVCIKNQKDMKNNIKNDIKFDFTFGEAA